MAVFDYSPLMEMQQIPIPSVSHFTEPSLDIEQYHSMLSLFVTGVSVITLLHHGQPIGFTASSFNSISTEPAFISFCSNDTEMILPLINTTKTFCVNILSDQQQHVYKIFSRRGGARFQTTEIQQAASGVPTLHGVLAWIECSVAAIHPIGQQLIVLGQVRTAKTIAEGKPLIFYKGMLGTFKPQ
jgi:3-hydroxy-9,10-secoandrosta-1,3,5(10)-triene-9,17-dione monooxygenase reductase component